VFDVENEPVPTVDMSSVEEPSQEDPRVDISDYTDGDLSVKTVQKGDKLLFYPVIQFDSGIANIKSDYYDVMDDMYKIISKYQSPIVVMGHTDNQPIATAAYPPVPTVVASTKPAAKPTPIKAKKGKKVKKKDIKSGGW
jgi:outer membrane protein OmpA-like peptidoglycan-associated protein